MEVGERVKKFRELRGLSTTKLGKLARISQSTISKLENGKKKADVDLLEKISKALDVSMDRLTGESASSIIEDRLEELNMSFSELAEKAKTPLAFLSNLDNVTPDEQDYEYVTRVADIIGLQPSVLRAALARQEIPFSDPVISTKDCFTTPLSGTDLEIYPVGKRIKVPIVGTVTAGPNGLAYEDYQGEEWVDAGQANGGRYFYLRIKGDSMIGDGILPGDLALVRETPEVGYGALAIAIVNGEEGTIKRVYKNEDSIILQASNPKYEPQIFKKENMENVKIIGEVKMTMRKYQ